jgi:large subunit ribosomal protein L3
MPQKRNPRFGSMQFWPRKRAKRAYSRIRSQNTNIKEAKMVGFAGYKVGMTHVTLLDEGTNSKTKGTDLNVPVTVVECPPIKVYGVKFYKRNAEKKGLYVVTEVVAKIKDKFLGRTLRVAKKPKQSFENIPEYDEIRLILFTQPSLLGYGKKKPEVFEVSVAGTPEEQLNYAKEKLGNSIDFSEIFNAGELVDLSAVTKGKGYQGPVKRFGVGIRQHKSEKTKRGPGSICGGWKAHGHMMYRVAHAGQMGFHQRTEYNKWIVDISNDITKINPKGGFVNYGFVKNTYVLVKGSIGGSKKRLIRFAKAVRPNTKIMNKTPIIKYVSLESKQR